MAQSMKGPMTSKEKSLYDCWYIQPLRCPGTRCRRNAKEGAERKQIPSDRVGTFGRCARDDMQGALRVVFKITARDLRASSTESSGRGKKRRTPVAVRQGLGGWGGRGVRFRRRRPNAG